MEMSVSPVEDYETLISFEDTNPQNHGGTNKGSSPCEESLCFVDRPCLDKNPALSPSQSLRSTHSVPEDIEIEAQIVAEFKKSNFKRLLAARMRALRDAGSQDLQKQVERLHTENGQLRAQFAKNGMELPGAMTTDESRALLLSDKQTTQNDGVMPESTLKSVREEPIVKPKCSDAASAAQLNKINTTFLGQDRLREIRQLAESAAPKSIQARGRVSLKACEVDQLREHHSTLMKENQRQVFADSEAMKDEVRRAILRQPYHVSQYYKTRGFAQAIARSSVFEWITIVVIAFNAFWIAIDTDYNNAKRIIDASFLFQSMEYFFIIFFLFEWIVRFMAFNRKLDGLKDTWFMFDTLLIILMVFDVAAMAMTATMYQDTKTRAADTSILKLFRMVRITRTARMARLLKALPELTILVKGILVAARSVFFTLCLLTLIMYIFAVAFRQVTEDTPLGEQYFRSVPYSMKALLLYATLPDMAQFVDDLGDEHIVLAICLLLFILLASLTVMNMLVGVLVEVVSVVSAVEKEELLVSFVKKKLLDMLRRSGLDADEDMMISRYEFELLLVLPQAAKVIQDVGVDPVGLVDFADYMFQDTHEDKLTFSEFIDLVLELRGCKHSTVKDVVDLRKMLMKHMEQIEMALASQATRLDAVTGDHHSGSDSCSVSDSGHGAQATSMSHAAAVRKSVVQALHDHPPVEAPQPLFSVNPAPPRSPSPKEIMSW